MNAALLFAGLMEAVKLSLIASYLFLPLGSPLPLFHAAAGLFAALLLGAYQRLIGGIVLFRLLAHAAGMGILYVLLLRSFQGSAGIAGRVLLGAGAVAFWLRGAFLGFKRFDHERAVARFDEGAGLFLFALSLAAVTGVKNPQALRLILPFVASAVGALGFSLNAGNKRGGLSARTGGVLAVPLALAIALGALLIAALVPILFAPAARAGNGLKEAFAAAEPYIGAFVRWLFGFGRSRGAGSESGASGGGTDAPSALSGDDNLARLIALVALWGLGGVVAVLLAGLAAYGLAKLVRLLFTRVEGGAAFDPTFLPAWLRRLLRRAARALSAAADRIDAFFRARAAVRSPAAAAYLRLLRGARFAGYARLPAETPREYARRLQAAFPRSARDAAFIVGEWEKETYGGEAEGAESAANLRTAGRRLRGAAFAAERFARPFRRR